MIKEFIGEFPFNDLGLDGIGDWSRCMSVVAYLHGLSTGQTLELQKCARVARSY